MAFKSYYLKVGRVRFYSGNGFYLEVPFRGTITAPIDRPRPAEVLVLDRGRITENAHYISAPDDRILEPMPISMNFRLGNTEPNYSKLLAILRTPTAGSLTKTVGSNSWTTAKGSTQVQNADPLGTALHTTPSFTDPAKFCVNVEALWEDSEGSADRGFKWGDVYFPPEQQLTEEEGAVMVGMNGEVYGNISLLTAFTAGTEG